MLVLYTLRNPKLYLRSPVWREVRKWWIWQGGWKYGGDEITQWWQWWTRIRVNFERFEHQPLHIEMVRHRIVRKYSSKFHQEWMSPSHICSSSVCRRWIEDFYQKSNCMKPVQAATKREIGSNLNFVWSSLVYEFRFAISRPLVHTYKWFCW